jgi:polar amino acid transport system substrate-binding protein
MTMHASTRTDRRIRRAGAAAIAAVLVVVMTACSSSETPPIVAPTSSTIQEEAAPAAEQPDCGDPVASFAPQGALPRPGEMPTGSYMRKIQERGRLIVGASADTFRMGARNPFTGEIEGFDIDQLRRVSDAIFGDPNKIEFKIVTYAQRIPALEGSDPEKPDDDEVDIVAHSMTINCARWEQISFSSQYYSAGQKVLVGVDSEAENIEDLADQRVCTQNGTTSIERLKDYPDIEVVAVDDVSDCVVKFQLGEADAISGDDTVLAGFVAQDPYAKVLPEAFSEEPYGMGINKANEDFVRFVNGVLEKSRTDGTWEQSYLKWLSTDGQPQTPPPAVYGRNPNS